jgi:hypothetical protein
VDAVLEKLVLFFCMGTGGFEDKETLADVIDAGKQAHSGEQGRVFPDGERIIPQKIIHCGFRKSVGEKIGNGNIGNKGGDHRHIPFFYREGEIFVEKKAGDTAHNIIGGGREPVMDAKKIVQNEHEPRTYEGVHNADENEFEKRAVKEYARFHRTSLFFLYSIAGRIVTDSS